MHLALARAGALALVAMLFATAGAAAAPIPAKIKIVGASCDRPLQLTWDKRSPQAGTPAHGWDERYLSISGVMSPSPRAGFDVWTVTWKLEPAVKLCQPSWTRLGRAEDDAITTPSGSAARDVSPDGPGEAKLSARFAQAIELRDDLGKTRLRTLVGGWARRHCAIKGSSPDAAGVLGSLVKRSGATGCKAPKKLRPTAPDLLHNLVAYFNDQREKGTTAMGREYYRVLAQLTTFTG